MTWNVMNQWLAVIRVKNTDQICDKPGNNKQVTSRIIIVSIMIIRMRENWKLEAKQRRGKASE